MECTIESMSDVLEADTFPKEGVSLRYILEEFIPACGGRQALRDLTTAQVCERHTKAPTRHLQCSFCAMMQAQDHPAVFKEAAVFISHAQMYKFLDLISALSHHFRDNLEVGIWLDMFSINQHWTNDWSFEWLSQTFQSAIGEFGHVVMVMSPWNNPLPFTRAWCVFESYCAAKCEAKFEIALCEQDRKAFLEDIMTDPQRSIEKMLATVQAERSEATKKEDKEHIFGVIREEVGFASLDSMVLERYRSWVIKTALGALADYPEGTRYYLRLVDAIGGLYRTQGEYKQAELFYQKSLSGRKEKFGENHPNTLVTMHNLALLHEDRGRFHEAESFYLDCLLKRRALLGCDHIQTLQSMMNLVWVYEEQGRLDKSESLCLECLENQRAKLGENHQDTLISMSHLGVLHWRQGRLEEAEEILLACLKRKQKHLGQTHPNTLITTNNLAVVYEDRGRHDKAVELYQACLEKTRVQLGENHPETLTYMNNLADLYQRQGNLAEAEIMFLDCLEKEKAILGANHPEALVCRNNLALLYIDQGRLDDAELLYDDYVEEGKVKMCDNHPATPKAKAILGTILYRQGRLARIEEICLDCPGSPHMLLGEDDCETVFPPTIVGLQ